MFSFSTYPGFRFAQVEASDFPEEDIHYLKKDFGNLIAGDVAFKKNTKTNEIVIVFPYKIEDEEAVNEKLQKWTLDTDSTPPIK